MSVRILTDEERAQHERIHGRFGDARAQLWARVYATEFEVFRMRAPHLLDTCRAAAREAAAAAVADFDEHYLGRAPSNKG